MSENQATVRYNFRLRPGATAEARLILEWNCSRWVWNQCVEAGNAAYKAHKEGVEHEAPTHCRMSKKLTAWRAEFEWLREGSCVVQQQTIRKWAVAHQQAFKQHARGWPQFKSGKIDLPSLGYAANAFRLKDGKLHLVGGISIPIVWSRELPSVPTSCVVSRDADGHWNVSFVVRRDNENFPPSDGAVGIDWGVAKVATCSEPGFNLECGNQILNSAKSLKEAQRKLSRAKIGSKNRVMAKQRVAAIHIRIARQRKDRAFKWARKVVTAFGKIAVEDFKPRFLSKTRMAKKATDGAIGITKQILLNLAENAKRTVALIAPAYTTTDCAECGTRAKLRLALSQRTFVCDTCGHTADRDENAARVIRARAGFDPANVDDVRPSHGFGCAVAV